MKENIAFGFEFLRHILISRTTQERFFFFAFLDSVVFIGVAILKSE